MFKKSKSVVAAAVLVSAIGGLMPSSAAADGSWDPSPSTSAWTYKHAGPGGTADAVGTFSEAGEMTFTASVDQPTPAFGAELSFAQSGGFLSKRFVDVAPGVYELATVVDVTEASVSNLSTGQANVQVYPSCTWKSADYLGHSGAVSLSTDPVGLLAGGTHPGGAVPMSCSFRVTSPSNMIGFSIVPRVAVDTEQRTLYRNPPGPLNVGRAEARFVAVAGAPTLTRVSD